MKLKPSARKLFIILSFFFLCCMNSFAERVLEEQAAAYFKEGIEAQKEGDFGYAATLYEKAIYANPDFKEAYNNLGTIYMQKGDLKAAEEYYRQAIMIDRKYSIALQNLALVYAERKDYDKFFEFWKMANGLEIFTSFIIDEGTLD